MSYCLNPNCRKPQNPDTVQLCRGCGAKLLLKDRYRPIKPIAQGGFGKTFLAIDEDKPSKPRCVIKQFLPTTQSARHVKKAADLFEQEALRLEELGGHPQIPTLLAHFSQDRYQYLVQEYISGKTLAELLQEQGAFTEAQVWEVLTSLLPVLDFIHSHGVIHRDIKPSNIILTPGLKTKTRSQSIDWAGLLQALSVETAQGFRDLAVNQQRFSEYLSQNLSKPPRDMAIADYGRWQQMATAFTEYFDLSYSQRQFLVADASRLLYEMRRKYGQKTGKAAGGQMVLVDFGAAKAAVGTALIRTGTAIGSPEYLAPEQARGRAVFASDLFSLGVTCIHLLTGQSPFDLFDSSQDVWVWRKYLVSPVSNKLGRVLDRMLESGLNRRYQSATEVIDDLEVQLPVAVPSVANGTRRAAAKIPPFIVQPSLPSAPPVVPMLEKTVLPVAQPKRQAAKAKVTQPPGWQCSCRLANPGKVYAIALCPEMPILATTSGTTIKLWDTQSGQSIRTLTGHIDLVYSLVVSSDGNLLISGSADKSIRLWEVQTGQRLGNLNLHSDTVLSLTISPNGQILASGSLRDPIKLWNLVKQREQGKLEGHPGRVDALAFSPDGKILVSAGGDAAITIWNLMNGEIVKSLKGHNQAIVTLGFSPDGKTLATGSWDGTVKLWSTQTWREKRTLSAGSGRVYSLSFSPDGKTLAVGNDTLTLWNPRSGKETVTLAEQAALSAIAFQSNNKTIASASWDGSVRIWNFAAK